MKTALGLARAQLRELGRVVELVDLGVELVDDLALVEALEAGDHVLARLVVGREHVESFTPVSCRCLPIASGDWSLFQEVEK